MYDITGKTMRANSVCVQPKHILFLYEMKVRRRFNPHGSL